MKILKIILFISIYIAIVSAKEWNVKYGDEIKSIRDDCLAKHTIPEQNFKNIKNFTFDNVLEVRQYLLCTAKELGIIDADNNIISGNVVEQFRMDIEKRVVVEQIVGKCETDTKGETPEDVRIYKFFTCLLSDQNEIGQKILAAAKKLAVNDQQNSDALKQPDPNKIKLEKNDQNQVHVDVPVV